MFTTNGQEPKPAAKLTTMLIMTMMVIPMFAMGASAASGSYETPTMTYDAVANETTVELNAMPAYNGLAIDNTFTGFSTAGNSPLQIGLQSLTTSPALTAAYSPTTTSYDVQFFGEFSDLTRTTLLNQYGTLDHSFAQFNPNLMMHSLFDDGQGHEAAVYVETSPGITDAFQWYMLATNDTKAVGLNYAFDEGEFFYDGVQLKVGESIVVENAEGLEFIPFDANLSTVTLSPHIWRSVTDGTMAEEKNWSSPLPSEARIQVVTNTTLHITTMPTVVSPSAYIVLDPLTSFDLDDDKAGWAYGELWGNKEIGWCDHLLVVCGAENTLSDDGDGFILKYTLDSDTVFGTPDGWDAVWFEVIASGNRCVHYDVDLWILNKEQYKKSKGSKNWMNDHYDWDAPSASSAYQLSLEYNNGQWCYQDENYWQINLDPIEQISAGTLNDAIASGWADADTHDVTFYVVASFDKKSTSTDNFQYDYPTSHGVDGEFRLKMTTTYDGDQTSPTANQPRLEAVFDQDMVAIENNDVGETSGYDVQCKAFDLYQNPTMMTMFIEKKVGSAWEYYGQSTDGKNWITQPQFSDLKSPLGVSYASSTVMKTGMEFTEGDYRVTCKAQWGATLNSNYTEIVEEFRVEEESSGLFGTAGGWISGTFYLVSAGIITFVGLFYIRKEVPHFFNIALVSTSALISYYFANSFDSAAMGTIAYASFIALSVAVSSKFGVRAQGLTLAAAISAMFLWFANFNEYGLFAIPVYGWFVTAMGLIGSGIVAMYLFNALLRAGKK